MKKMDKRTVKKIVDEIVAVITNLDIHEFCSIYYNGNRMYHEESNADFINKDGSLVHIPDTNPWITTPSDKYSEYPNIPITIVTEDILADVLMGDYPSLLDPIEQILDKYHCYVEPHDSITFSIVDENYEDRH